MLRYIGRRILLMIPILIGISIISFIVIQLPPGDFVTAYVAQLEELGEIVDPAEAEALRVRYGLDQPRYIQYLKWIWGVLRGDLGRSLEWNRPVSALLAERIPLTVVISLASLIYVYLIGISVGTYSATHQYSIPDYIFTFFGFIGLAVPNFLFALILLWVYYLYTGNVAVGLFSSEFIMAPWSFAKLFDMLKHLWMPALVVGTAGTCGFIRTMRANLLDELQKPYVMVARAKGLTERRLLFKYPFRIAINPMMSTIGWLLPGLISGALLTSLVLGLPTVSPIMLGAILNQDMYLAGSVILVLSTLTVIGTLISDILLAWVDPRIVGSI